MAARDPAKIGIRRRAIDKTQGHGLVEVRPLQLAMGQIQLTPLQVRAGKVATFDQDAEVRVSQVGIGEVGTREVRRHARLADMNAETSNRVPRTNVSVPALDSLGTAQQKLHRLVRRRLRIHGLPVDGGVVRAAGFEGDLRADVPFPGVEGPDRAVALVNSLGR